MADSERSVAPFAWLDSRRFNQADPGTPLFDGLWAVLMPSHTDDPAPRAKAVAVADESDGKHSDADGNHIADAAEEELTDPHRYAQTDGTVYVRADPDEFEEAS